jgi:deoxyribodipyrimidine photo-lyase
MVNKKRVRQLNNAQIQSGPVVYWMSRDQRVSDNWALLYAQELSLELKQPLVVVFCLTKNFLGAGERQYSFMLSGLLEVKKHLESLHIPFVFLEGEIEKTILKFAKEHKVGAVVTDFSPLKIGRSWREKIAKNLNCAMFEIDAHNIVPVWTASPKQEFGAYTLRPKIHKLLPEFLENYPALKKAEKTFHIKHDNQLLGKKYLTIKTSKTSFPKQAGESGAKKVLQAFLENRLKNYNEQRNNPNLDAQSELSAYIHFGHISSQSIALEVHKLKSSTSSESFLEELIVRKELSDNFCFYNSHYDSFEGFPNWAKKTLNEHRKDTREYIYTKDEFEKAKTHDLLWDSAQNEMVQTGKMHGYMRMYWGKKILEWTKCPEDALEIAIYLNNKYELDGRDPNGYTGIAWSIGGVHDRAWFERPIFGKIRYMNYNGCKSKFNVKEYIAKWS